MGAPGSRKKPKKVKTKPKPKGKQLFFRTSISVCLCGMEVQDWCPVGYLRGLFDQYDVAHNN